MWTSACTERSAIQKSIRASALTHTVADSHVKHLFDAAAVEEIRTRITRLRADAVPQWGRMNVGQTLAHCSGVLELALGDRRPARALIGRILGWALKRMALGNDAPMRRNSPTIQALAIVDERDVETERRRLLALLERFAASGPAGCTRHPHPFFGRLSPQEWAIFECKHLDHHLRQFGA